jgi:hypothetical protein
MALLFASRPASADFIIEFDDITIQGGSLTQSGSIITGTDIVFDIITLQDTSSSTVLKAAQCGLTGSAATACLLNFTLDTGTSTGTITMTAPGGVYDAGADNQPFTGDTGAQILLNGDTVLSGILTGGGFTTTTTFGADGFDEKNPALLDFFDLFIVGDFTLSNTEIRRSTGGVVRDADLINSGDIFFIPEPGMLMLFGVGLFGVARRLTRRV